jgi:predicted esterase
MQLRRASFLSLALMCALGGCNLKKFFEDPRCESTADCFNNQVCSANLCVAIGSLGTGRRCWATRDCQEGQTCQLVPIMSTVPGEPDLLDQRCIPAGAGDTGASCTSSGDCKAGLRCEMVGFGGTCQSAGTKDRGDSCMSTGECLAGLACGPQKTCLPYTEAFPPFAGVDCPAEAGSFRSHFVVPRPGAPLADFFRLPFPSDVRVDAAGHIDLSDFPRPGPTPLGVDLVQLYVDALTADFDGFSAVAPITFRFSGPVGEASLAAAATFVDLTTGKPVRALASSHAPRTKYSCADRVVVEHAVGEVLQPRHRYAVILRGVTDATGGMAAQDPDLIGVLGDARPAGDEPLGRAWDLYAPLRAWMALHGVAAGNVSAASIFTVGDPVGTVSKIKDAIAAAPAPVLTDLTHCAPGVTSPCADGGPDRVCGGGDPAYDEIQGRISIPIFQQGTAPYLDPKDGGGIDGAAPTIVRTEAVCFALTVPKGSAPASGWPLVIYAHGTGGSFRSFINEGIGPQLATAVVPFATLSYDGVEHGERKNGSAQSSDNLVFNVLNPHAARDNVVQSGADVLQLLRAGALTLPGSLTGNPIAFDTAHVAFFGHSQGANAGHLGLAYAEAARAAVLSGSGGGVIDGVLSKTSPIDIARGMQFLIGEPLDVSHPAMVLFQTFFDRSDPLVYAPLLIRRTPSGIPSKHVFHGYGVGDTYAPPRTLANITKALGIPLSAPMAESIDDPISAPVPLAARPIIANLDSGDGGIVTGATFQYTPQSYDGHFVLLREPSAVTDWTSFLTTYAASGHPYVP